jgi:VWFA-related protein
MDKQGPLLLLTLSSLLTGQEPPTVPVLRVTTRLVEVGVVVRHKNGPVSNLTQDDFKIFDRGKRQKIAFFRKNSSRFAAPASSPADPDVFTNRSQVNPDEPRGVTIFLLDALNTQFPDQLQAKKEFLKLLGQIRPDDRIGVYLLGKQLRVLQEFTSDSRRLTEAVQRDPVEFTRQMDIFRDPNESASTKDQAKADRALMTASAIEAIAAQLAGVPGRKNLIWISAAFPIELNRTQLADPIHLGGGTTPPPQAPASGADPGSRKLVIQLPGGDKNVRRFTPEVDRITRALNAANITMYPVDARGLVLVPDERPLPSPSGFATMELVADQTGGVAFHDTNDIHGAIAKALEDSEDSYTLGFYPDSGQVDSSFHTLKVEVNRPGVEVRARKGYIATPEEKSAGPRWKDQIAEALMSPLEDSGIALSTRRDRVNRQLTIHITGSDLEFDRDGDHWRGEMDMVFAQKAADGRALGALEKPLHFNLTSSEYEVLMKDGYSLTVPYPPPGVAEVRLVVLDRNTGRVGSLSIMLGN